VEVLPNVYLPGFDSHKAPVIRHVMKWPRNCCLTSRPRSKFIAKAALCRSVDLGFRLFDATALSHLVDALRKSRGRQSMAHPEPRVADSLASTNREFCCDAGSLVGTLRLRSSPRRGSCNFRYHSRTSNGRL